MKVMHGDSVEARVGALGVKVNELEHRMTECFEQVDKHFEQVDKRFEQVDKRFEQVDKRFEQVDKRFEVVEGELREFRRDTKLGFDAITNRLDGLNDKLDRTNRSIALSAASQTAGYMAGFAALVGLVATQI
jgi:tetrahydromethanopterin S-methyltransferase subunit G